MQIGLNHSEAKSNVSLSHNSSSVRSKQQNQEVQCSVKRETWPEQQTKSMSNDNWQNGWRAEIGKHKNQSSRLLRPLTPSNSGELTLTNPAFAKTTKSVFSVSVPLVLNIHN